MFISSLTERGATPGLVHLWSFTMARHQVISENVANWGTPNYKAKQLDARAFQKALGQAFKERRGDASKPLDLPSTKQFSLDEHGHLQVNPARTPSENVLFHDGSNMSIERQMAQLAENGMLAETVTTLLRGKYEGLRKAISGRT